MEYGFENRFRSAPDWYADYRAALEVLCDFCPSSEGNPVTPNWNSELTFAASILRL